MKLNRTALRTVQIMSLVAEHPEGVSLDQICAALSMPKTSAYDIVSTLIETNMLQVSYGQKMVYLLSVGAYRIGSAYRNNYDHLRAFEEFLAPLAHELKKTVFYAVPNDVSIVYLIKHEPDQPILTTGRVGGTNPAYCTALGKAILSVTPERELDALLARMNLEPRTEYTLTDIDAFRADLALSQKRGYALEVREFSIHGTCVAAPVFGAEDHVIGAISASDIYYPDEDLDAVGRRMREVAQQLSAIAGYIP